MRCRGGCSASGSSLTPASLPRRPGWMGRTSRNAGRASRRAGTFKWATSTSRATGSRMRWAPGMRSTGCRSWPRCRAASRATQAPCRRRLGQALHPVRIHITGSARAALHSPRGASARRGVVDRAHPAAARARPMFAGRGAEDLAHLNGGNGPLPGNHRGLPVPPVPPGCHQRHFYESKWDGSLRVNLVLLANRGSVPQSPGA